MTASPSLPGGPLHIVPPSSPPVPLRVLLVEDRASDAALLVHELVKRVFRARVETRGNQIRIPGQLGSNARHHPG